MWQVDFFIVMERERARQLELERRRALRDAASDRAAPDGARTGRHRRLLLLPTAFVALVAALPGAIRSALDRPVIGPHHL